MFVQCFGGEKVEFSPPRLNGPTDGPANEHDARPEVTRQVELSAALVEVDFVVPDHVVHRGDRLAPHGQPEELKRAGGQQLRHYLVVKADKTPPVECSRGAGASPALIVQPRENMLAFGEAFGVARFVQDTLAGGPYVPIALGTDDTIAVLFGQELQVLVPRFR